MSRHSDSVSLRHMLDHAREAVDLVKGKARGDPMRWQPGGSLSCIVTPSQDCPTLGWMGEKRRQGQGLPSNE